MKRARYNSSLIDANVTEPGEQYQNLNETYVVFITENDVLGENLPIYHVDRIIRETGKMFNDQSHIIYVNSQIKDETALGKLMHDFTCTNAKDMYYEVLADRVHYFKEDEKGVAIMCKAMEDMRNEAAKMKAAAGALALSLGIAIQNFPEGAIISMPLRAEGESKGKAFAGGVLSGVVEPIGAVVTILAAQLVIPALPYLLSFAAGAMLYVVVEELIPEMSQGRHSNLGTVFFAVGFSVMMVLDVALG